MTKQSQIKLNKIQINKVNKQSQQKALIIKSSKIQFIHLQYFKYMIFKRSLISLLIILILLNTMNSQDMVQQINYSEHIINPEHKDRPQIELTFQRSVFDKFQFPKTWDIHQFLVSNLQKQQQLPQISNINGQITFLKSQIGQFLKLSNKAELLVKNIQQLPPMQNDLTLIIRDQQFAVLSHQQGKLDNLNHQINRKGVQLEVIVKQLMAQQQNPMFKQAALSFQKRALVSKIELLKNLLNQAQSDKKAIGQKNNDKIVKDFFKQLEKIFQDEEGTINQIDTLLISHNNLTTLKARVTSLASQLKAYDLTLAQKEQCADQFEKIKQKQAHDRQVIKLIETLKQKKNQFNQPNKYCQGVVKKLIQRVKKVLIGYDYIYECAQELGQIKSNRDKVQKELEDAQNKLNELQMSREVQSFRKNFQKNRVDINRKVQQLKKFQLDNFYQYPQLIGEAIKQAQKRIAEIEEKLTGLASRSDYNLDELQNQMREKVSQIKQLKGTYCKQHQKYRQDTQIIQRKLSKLQKQQAHNEWIRKVYEQKYNELEQIKQEMRKLEMILLEFLM